jgi:hypothetical protein
MIFLRKNIFLLKIMDQIITILTLILIITFSYFIYKTYYASTIPVKPSTNTNLPYSENYWDYPYYGNPNWGWRRGRYGRWGRY